MLVRPSFVLGGRAMEIVYDETALSRYVSQAMEVSRGKPILIDKFLESAIEVDVDCLSDGNRTIPSALPAARAVTGARTSSAMRSWSASDLSTLGN